MPFSIGIILTLFVTSAITAASQILFKQTTNVVTSGTASTTLAQRLFDLLMMPNFLLALCLYGAAFLLWIWLLSKSSLSILYPIGLSLNVVLALIAARFFLHESITTVNVVGIIVIITGIFIVTR